MHPTAYRYITRTEAARLFGLTVRGLELQFAKRTGPYCIKLGGAVRYPIDAQGLPLPWPEAEKAAA